MTIHELNDASSIIYEEAGADANVILGCVLDKNLSDEVRVTVIATGLDGDHKREFDSTPHAMKTNLNPLRTETEESLEDNRIPAFREAPSQSDGAESSPGFFDSADKNDDVSSDGPVVTFGEDLDVPAFIRNRQE